MTEKGEAVPFWQVDNFFSMRDDKHEYSWKDVIASSKSFFAYMIKKGWLLLLTIFIGVGLGAMYFFKQKPRYEAISTFILEEKTGGAGGLAGLASQFGFDLGGLSSGGSIFAGDNIINILSSKRVVYNVLLSSTTDSAKSGNTLADLYMSFSFPKKNKLTDTIRFSPMPMPLSFMQDSMLNVIYETVVRSNLRIERVSKQGTIMRVQVTALNRDFARLMTQRLIDEARKLYLDIRVGNAQENIRQLQRRSDSLLALLNYKSYRAAASLPLDINPGIRTATVPVEIATRDKTVLATLYTEVTKNLEASKLLLSQQTPVIQVLDQPGYLLRDNKKTLVFILAFSVAVSIFLFVTGAFVIHFAGKSLK